MNYVFQWESRHPQIDSDEGMGNGYGHVVQKLMFFCWHQYIPNKQNNHTMLQPPQKSKPIIIPQLPSILKNATRPFKSSEYTSYSSLDDIKPQSTPNSPIVSESIPKTKSRLFACGSGFCLWPSSSEPTYSRSQTILNTRSGSHGPTSEESLLERIGGNGDESKSFCIII